MNGTVETRLVAEMTVSRAASTILLPAFSCKQTKMLNLAQINFYVSDF